MPLHDLLYFIQLLQETEVIVVTFSCDKSLDTEEDGTQIKLEVNAFDPGCLIH